VSDLIKFLVGRQMKGELGYFNMDMDEETEKCSRLFYMSAAQVAAFRRFGQFLVMDATCKTNRFGMPLVLIVGVGDTATTVLLAVALVSQEDIESYLWVLKCIKHTVGQHAPFTIVQISSMYPSHIFNISFKYHSHIFHLSSRMYY
jgi:hypothetical protein